MKNHCFDLAPIFGTHRASLKSALDSLPAGSRVIEHGVGPYSSPLIARYDVHVLCVEEMPGWAEWANWAYDGKAIVVDRAKSAIGELAGAGLVFIDGATRERGDMLKWSLAAKVPLIVAHDTEEDYAKMYGYHRHLLEAPGYSVEHDGDRPRTTTWRLL